MFSSDDKAKFISRPKRRPSGITPSQVEDTSVGALRRRKVGNFKWVRILQAKDSTLQKSIPRGGEKGSHHKYVVTSMFDVGSLKRGWVVARQSCRHRSELRTGSPPEAPRQPPARGDNPDMSRPSSIFQLFFHYVSRGAAKHALLKRWCDAGWIRGYPSIRLIIVIGRRGRARAVVTSPRVSISNIGTTNRGAQVTSIEPLVFSTLPSTDKVKSLQHLLTARNLFLPTPLLRLHSPPAVAL